MTHTAIPLSHPMYRSPEANHFFWNTLIRKRTLEYYRTKASPEREEPTDDGYDG